MGGVKTPFTPFLSRSAGHDPLREALILLRAVDHNTLQGSLRHNTLKEVLTPLQGCHHNTLQESLLLFRAATIS